MDLQNNYLLSQLDRLGQTAKLDIEVNLNDFDQQILNLNKDWRVYNSRKNFNRYGISLTSIDGKQDGTDLDSLYELEKEHGKQYSETDFTTPTPAYQTLKSLQPIAKIFGDDTCRSHLIKLEAGGFFPPHRDSPGLDDTIRLVVFLSRCGDSEFEFILDGKLISFVKASLYYVNTRLIHSCFSYKGGTVMAVYNIKVSERSVSNIINHLEVI